MRIARLCGVVLLMAGCKKLETGARETFSQQFSCPEERITVAARADVDAYALQFAAVLPVPPAEVRDDPARLAVWKRNQDSARAEWNARFRAFEVQGCEHQGLYLCAHPNGDQGSSPNLAAVSCTPAPAGPPPSK